jgi:hypothetical protein
VQGFSPFIIALLVDSVPLLQAHVHFDATERCEELERTEVFIYAQKKPLNSVGCKAYHEYPEGTKSSNTPIHRIHARRSLHKLLI